MNLNAPLRAQQAQAEPAPLRELVEPPNLDPDFQRLLGQPTNARDLLLNDGTFDRIWRIAESMAQGRHTVPKHLQGNLADCIAVVTQAFEWGMNPYVVAQKTHVVNGTLGYESQLVMAVVQRSGAIVGHFHFEWDKDGNATLCRAGAILRGDNHITWTEWYSSAAVLVKNSPLWKSNVPQQMGYVQGRNWCRLYAPGAILGVYTAEELLDSAPAGATYDDDRSQPSQPPAARGPQRKSSAAPTPPAASAPPPAAAPALPAYADEAFAKNLPLWAKLVADGKKAPGDLLATLATKATFSEEQKARILSLKKAPEAGPAPAAPAAPTPAPADGGEHDDFIGQMDAAEEAAK